MSNLRERVMKAAETDSVPADEWVSEAELRIRNSIKDAETLPARAAGYSWGRKDEAARLRPLIERLAEVIETADRVKQIWMGTIECTDIFPMFDTLTALTRELERMEGAK